MRNCLLSDILDMSAGIRHNSSRKYGFAFAYMGLIRGEGKAALWELQDMESAYLCYHALHMWKRNNKAKILIHKRGPRIYMMLDRT